MSEANLGRNTERGPGFAQFDFSLLKTTKLGERKSPQFRAEFFNVPNHPNFAVPSAVFRNPTAFGKVLSRGEDNMDTTMRGPL